jgi:16S rRNA processing protein RimM
MGVFGLQGELRLFLYNPDTELFHEPSPAWLVYEDGEREEIVLSIRAGAGRRILGAVEGVESPEEAEALVGAELVLPARELPPAEEGSWYHRDLLGLPVRTQSGVELGRLAEIYGDGEHDTWLVRQGRQERFIPAEKGVIIAVELGQYIIVADGAGDEL